jgi:predicted RNase H-like nuclease (RuvC/YqgF family)
MSAQKELEAERERNKQLEKDIRGIEHAMIKQNVAANMDIIALKQKIDRLEKTVAQLKADKVKQDASLAESEEKHQAEVSRLKATLQLQNDQLEKLEADLQEQQSLKRLTKQLQEDATNMERENQSLKLQHENFSTLLAQSTLQNSEISALKTANDQLQDKVTAEQSTIDIVGQQQMGLLEKLKKGDEMEISQITDFMNFNFLG